MRLFFWREKKDTVRCVGNVSEFLDLFRVAVASTKEHDYDDGIVLLLLAMLLRFVVCSCSRCLLIFDGFLGLISDDPRT